MGFRARTSASGPVNWPLTSEATREPDIAFILWNCPSREAKICAKSMLTMQCMHSGQRRDKHGHTVTVRYIFGGMLHV
jgi:hypothetical protein